MNWSASFISQYPIFKSRYHVPKEIFEYLKNRKTCGMVGGINPSEVHPMQETLFNFQQFLIDELPGDTRQIKDKKGILM